jgi:hypothetical protein
MVFIFENPVNKIKRMSEKQFRKRLLLSLLLLICLPAMQVETLRATSLLSSQAQISILIASPCEQDLFSLFGHAALRISDPELKIDYVFNYGVPQYETNLGNFFRLFGNLYGELYAVATAEIKQDYMQKETRLTELIFNFSREEKEALWQSLLAEARAKNKKNRYDVLKKNCTSFPLRLIKENTAGTIIYKQAENHSHTYRELCRLYLNDYPWIRFLMDMTMGIKADTPLAFEETFYIPEQMRQALLNARIQSPDGTERPLALSSTVWIDSLPADVKPGFFTPFRCFWALLFFVFTATLVEWRKKTVYPTIDILLFAATGLAGLYLFYLNFITPQWYTFPNRQMLWLHPLHLPGAVFFAFKRLNKAAFYYHIFNLTTVSFMLAGVFFIPQAYNAAFIPWMLCLWIRSASRDAVHCVSVLWIRSASRDAGHCVSTKNEKRKTYLLF